MMSLDLALVGNGTVGALIDPHGTINWACVPRFDGDPAFCSLLHGGSGDADFGFFAVDLLDGVREEQEYVRNTPILVTRLYSSTGAAIEITDFAPRFHHYGRMFCPMMFVRQLRRLAGHPRIRLRVRPAHDYGAHRCGTTNGSHHIRYVGADVVLRLTTDASITAVLEETPFFLTDGLTLMLGPDETVNGAVGEVARHFADETAAWWRQWVRGLAIPFEWQDAVIRSAITLKLNSYEDTGAIVAALTTSIPEAAGSGRNWDYRYCWLRDAYFVVNALNRLGASHTMERYLAYIINIVAAGEGRLQPLYGINGRSTLDERVIDTLAGYRGMGPVRVGNDAWRQAQHDVYGSAILAVTQVFFDHRLIRRGDEALFRQLEPLGECAAELFDRPDAGIWEFRGEPRVHTFSAVMCWAACDRLARIASHLGLDDRAVHWRDRARAIHETVCDRAWNATIGSFVATMDGSDTLDASLLRMHDVGFLDADDPRFAGAVRAIERRLRRGDFIFRYVEKDDFGEPENAFVVCTLWYINALAALGRRDEARSLFEQVLACRNRHGLLAEHIDPRTKEQWGNFVQTYSMVGLISSAVRLSVRWDQAL